MAPENPETQHALDQHIWEEASPVATVLKIQIQKTSEPHSHSPTPAPSSLCPRCALSCAS